MRCRLRSLTKYSQIKTSLYTKALFLKELAYDLISNHGNNLAKIAIIFPNKRASLWMNDYLLEAAEGKPVFAPQYYSISELFLNLSELVLADHIQLVSLLHKSYCKITGENQPLDKFYAWGEILLADFDNADKSLADARQLFTNITNLHEMDSIDYLSEEQKEFLMHYFNYFTQDKESKIQQKFISLWNNLFNIYSDYKTKLRSLGIAYEGMLYRDVVENAEYEDFKYEKYYAIGFNKRLRCEEKLFLTLADKLSIKDDEASILTVNKEAEITIAQALTDDLQTRFIEQWLKENNRIDGGRRTAIVLCDEHMLPSATYCLPENVGPVNITAGFPLAETQPASYIATLLELYTEGLTKDANRYRLSYLRNVESHPMHKYTEKSAVTEKITTIIPRSVAAILSLLEEVITAIASSMKQLPKDHNYQLLQEATFRTYNIITRLKSLHEQSYLDIDILTLARLYKEIILTATIPFHGEPAKGIQIMGMLETRNLDFDHILMLSCNEGILPKGANENSIIPYTIKKAFSLNTADDRTNIFAYYFYRLLKRCKDVTLVYNSSGSDTSPGEMSRFLLNLIVNNHTQINQIALQTDFISRTKRPQPYEASEAELHQYIEDRKREGISPSAINVFMRCEKKFYYQYYRKLREEHDEEDTMDAADFGTFFHNVAEDFYKKFGTNTITSAMLEEYVKKDALLVPHINEALKKTKVELYGEDVRMESNGMEELLKSIIKEYMKRMLKNDMKHTPFSIVSLENRYYKYYTVSSAEGDVNIRIGGAVDRLDRLTDENGREFLRVIDYKTGTDHTKEASKFVEVADMFDESISGAGYYRQASLYSIAIADNSNYNPDNLPVAPALYYIRNKAVGSKEEKFNPIITLNKEPICDINEVKEDYENLLMKVLHSMLNKRKFNVAEDLESCKYCPFAELCME